MTDALALTSLEAGTGRPGTPLLVMHGLFGSARNWQGHLKKLAERRPVYALDMRNHGGSPWSDVMTYPAMAADLVRFMDDRGFARAQLLGHSMGGKAAMACALAHPDRVEKLVVADISPVSYGHSHANYVAAMKAVDLDAAGRRAEAEAQLTPAVPEAGIRGFLGQNLVTEDGKLRWRLNLDVLDRAMDDLVDFPDFGGATYGGPTLFVGGAKATYILPEYHDAIRRHFPTAEIEMIPDTGHWLHAEKPVEFLGIVERFL